MELTDYLKDKKRLTEEKLTTLLPGEEEYPPIIHDAMRYTLFLPGKRLRPILSLAVAEMLGGDEEKVLPLACAIEMIHSCSLILDDLPSMDDARLRRGKPSSHLVFGEDMAILAAIALLNQAYHIIFRMKNLGRVKEKLIIELGKRLSQAISTKGIIGGQVVDLRVSEEELDLPTLEYIHSHKTGSLFIFAAEAAAVLSGASDAELSACSAYAKNLGLAFQITDDILDSLGTEKEVGKDLRKDKGKLNFISYCGVSEAKKIVNELIEAAVAALSLFGKKGEVLIGLARYVESRRS
jgi:geranylgeranyl diphosphate synthase type II